jgi:hypothetical protein
MKKEFVVITETGNTSYCIKTEQPEIFRSFNAARARAESIAKSTPGETIKIFELTAEAVAPVQKAETSRLRSREHASRPRG